MARTSPARASRRTECPLPLISDGPINSKELFALSVLGGRRKACPGPLVLDFFKIQDIYLYVKGHSDAKIAPGRPAVKNEG